MMSTKLTIEPPITAPENTALRDQVDTILRDAMRDGTLEGIFRKWNCWNDDQPRLYQQAATETASQSNAAPAASTTDLVRRYYKSLAGE